MHKKYRQTHLKTPESMLRAEATVSTATRSATVDWWSSFWKASRSYFAFIAMANWMIMLTIDRTLLPTWMWYTASFMNRSATEMLTRQLSLIIAMRQHKSKSLIRLDHVDGKPSWPPPVPEELHIWWARGKAADGELAVLKHLHNCDTEEERCSQRRSLRLVTPGFLDRYISLCHGHHLLSNCKHCCVMKISVQVFRLISRFQHPENREI